MARKEAGSDATPASRGLRVTRDAEHELAALALVAVFGDVRALAVQASVEDGRALVEPPTLEELEAPHLWLSTRTSEFVKALCVALEDGEPAAAFEACFTLAPDPQNAAASEGNGYPASPMYEPPAAYVPSSPTTPAAYVPSSPTTPAAYVPSSPTTALDGGGGTSPPRLRSAA
jgi:hypothetical protein